jgi:hypothetical protein
MHLLPDFRALLAEPMLLLGAITVAVIVLVLALMRKWSHILVGLLGGVGGYVLLGTPLGWHLAAVAERRGQCPDVAWFGPASGALVGSLVALVVRVGVRPLRGRGASITKPGPQ